MNDDITIRRDEWLKELEVVKAKPHMTDEEKEFFKDAIKMGVTAHRIFIRGIFEKTFGYRLGRSILYERMYRVKREMIESKELEEK